MDMWGPIERLLFKSFRFTGIHSWCYCRMCNAHLHKSILDMMEHRAVCNPRLGRTS